MGASGTSITTARDHIVGLAGNGIYTVTAASLTAIPAGATKRTVMVINTVLRVTTVETSQITGVLPGRIAPDPVAGSYDIFIVDPATGLEFGGSGLDVVHMDIQSFFSN